MMYVTRKIIVTANHMQEYVPENIDFDLFSMRCFWGAERQFWQTTRMNNASLAKPVLHDNKKR
jgi:hypothetical protein